MVRTAVKPRVKLLDRWAAAEFLGMAPKTVRNLIYGQRFAEPDVVIDGRPAWFETTLRQWQDARPGPGNHVRGPERKGGPRRLAGLPKEG